MYITIQAETIVSCFDSPEKKEKTLLIQQSCQGKINQTLWFLQLVLKNWKIFFKPL